MFSFGGVMLGTAFLGWITSRDNIDPGVRNLWSLAHASLGVAFGVLAAVSVLVRNPRAATPRLVLGIVPLAVLVGAAAGFALTGGFGFGMAC